MAMTKCKECGKEVSSDAAVCPSCGKRLKIPAWRIVLSLIILGISFNLFLSGISDITNDTSSSVSTSTNSTKSIITKANYNKIVEGMSEKQVKEILGNPRYSSTSESAGIGKITLKHYQETFGTISIDVYFSEGKVYMKNLTEI